MISHNVISARESEAAPLDLVVVTHGPDIPLLRHFLASYETYYRDPGRVLLFASRRDQAVLAQINLPRNAFVIHHEDVLPALAEASPFSQQLFLKLVAYRYVSGPFLIMDSDFLFLAPTRDEDFFHQGRPVWFYDEWPQDGPPLRWRAPSEAFVGQPIRHRYLQVPQWVIFPLIAEKLADRYPPERLLNQDSVSEFTVYGWFAHTYYSDHYEFARVGGPIQPIAGKVNQIPPTYLELDPETSFDRFRQYRYVAFWSHWDLAEAKMIEFFQDSQREHLGRVIRPPDTREVLLAVEPADIAAGRYRLIAGAYPDGWLRERVRFGVAPPPGSGALLVDLLVPANPADETWRLRTTIDSAGELLALALPPGHHRVRIPLSAGPGQRLHRVALWLGPGFQPAGNPDLREFRARLTGLSFA